MAEQENGENGFLPGEQSPPPSIVDSTPATLDDLKKLESSIVSQMLAMMMELIAPKSTPIINPNASVDVPPPQVNTLPLVDFVAQSTKPPREGELEDIGTSSKGKDESPVEGQLGGYHTVPPPSDYSLNVPIPMPRILTHGSPPLLDSNTFENWQFLMKSHVRSASTKLWRIIEEGYSPRDPKNLTRREVVDDQLNATAINMIHLAVTPKDRAHIRSLKTAKEAWNKLDKLFLGNESIQSSRFDEVNNMAISKKNVEDRVARTHNTRKLNLSLKMKDYGASESNVDPIEWSPDDLKAEYHEHLALAVKSFWNGIKRRSSIPSCYNCGDTRHLVAECIYERRKRSSCYNCGDKRHLVAECIYERRDENDGMLVRKSGFRSLSKGLSKLSSNNDIKISSTEKPRTNMLGDQDHLVDKLKANKCYLEENHGWSRSSRPHGGGKVKPSSRCYREDEEQEEIAPTRTTKRQRDAAAAAAGKRTVRGPQISMKDLKKAQFLQVRGANPYIVPKNSRLCPNTFFYHADQERIYNDVYGSKEFRCCPQFSINMEKLQAKPEYFGEALEICEEQGLIPLMTFSHDYSKEIICQFYATVVFLEDEDGFRSLKWMTMEHVMEATWEEFARGIGYELPEFEINFFKIHLQAKPMAKEKMANLYIPGRMLCGSAYNLLPVYDIMNRIYRSTINPKDTNHDEVHGFLVNLLVRTDEMRGSGKQLDIMDFIWHEMRDYAFLRKLPQYAPFIMRLICLKWDQANRGDLLEQCRPNITIHKEKSPLVKKHDPPCLRVLLFL
ncbi:hypothetical protein QYE76_039170 [Lolium multiflorum]|uniref:CCHC-type domain-containing protein n=1 Tax=Lolium multiflorum TaxID=4521 RepID=A0AAD8TAJ2_LOLMU|nr:hypothetical protein QYE76_039170 [Lolium multiflorum]